MSEAEPTRECMTNNELLERQAVVLSGATESWRELKCTGTGVLSVGVFRQNAQHANIA